MLHSDHHAMCRMSSSVSIQLHISQLVHSCRERLQPRWGLSLSMKKIIVNSITKQLTSTYHLGNNHLRACQLSRLCNRVTTSRECTHTKDFLSAVKKNPLYTTHTCSYKELPSWEARYCGVISIGSTVMTCICNYPLYVGNKKIHQHIHTN